MTAKTRSQGTISTGILCLGLLFGLTGFANGNNEPNKPANNIPLTKPDINQPQCVLCGHITDAKTGQPVTDATVIVEHAYKAETDTNGYYCIGTIYNDFDCRIAVDTNEYSGITSYESMPVVNLRLGRQTVKDFKLNKACMIDVRVVDEANQPIKGAELSVASLADRYNRDLSDMRRRTDNNGTALLGSLPPSKIKYQIVARHYSEADKKSNQRQLDYAPGELEVILNDTEVVELRLIVLQKGVDVEGNAQYEDGVPASDLKIQACPDWWNINSSSESYPIDANGNFTFRHITPGTYRLMALIPMGSGGSEGLSISQTTLPLADNGPLKLTIPQKSPQSLASIRGKLVFTSNKIANYANIEAYPVNSSSSNQMPHSTYWQNFRGDACDMNFVIDRLEPGKYRVTVTSSNVEIKTIEDVNAPSEGLIVELVSADPLRLKGTVFNSQAGQPIKQFKARINKIKALRGQNYLPPNQWFEFDNNEGTFEMDASGPGIYKIQIAAEGFPWTWSEDVNTDQNVPVVIKLSIGGSIKGSVVDEKGNPVSGAKVIPFSMAGALSPSAKEAFVSEDGAVETKDGKFVLNNLQPGKETLKVIHADYAPSIVKDIEVTDGQTTEEIKIVLLKGATVEGYVYDSQGKPEAGVSLKLGNTPGYEGYGNSKANQFAPVVTDSNGYYSVAGLSEGIYYITRQDIDKTMGVVKRSVIPLNGDTVRLDFGGKPVITGTIIFDGQPFANQKVTLSAADSPESYAFTCYCLTDNNGRFRFAGAPTGKYSVYYRRPPTTEYRSTKLTTFSVEGKDIDLGVIPQQPTCKVLVYPDNEANDPNWDTAKIYLMEGFHGKSARTVIFADKPEPGQPYVFSNIQAGDYSIVVSRTDGLNMQQEIKVEAKETSASLKMPVSTASISGRITGAQPTIEKQFRMLAIWQKDDKVIAYIKIKEDSTYRKDNLPAGRYSIGGNPRDPNHSLLEVELLEGEQKNIDIDASASSVAKLAMAGLRVNVVDKSGIPIPGVAVVLEGYSGTIEPLGGEYFMAKPGNYILRASYPGFKESRQQITMKLPDNWPSGYQPQTMIVRLEKQ